MDANMQVALLAKAREAASKAYAPYSNFPVGAAVLTADGSFYSGCNVENASYSLTICAEHSAVSAAIADGHREIVAVAVAAPRKANTTPCGACRQVLSEFQPSQGEMTVVLDDGASGTAITLGALLPQGFGPREIG
jgi:cytidine deaminase